MFQLLVVLALFRMVAEQPYSTPPSAPPLLAGAQVLRQHVAENEVAKNLQSIRLSAGLPRLQRVPASDSELKLTCSAAYTDQNVYDPELNNLETYVTSNLMSQTEQLKLVALGTSQFPDGGPRRPVYSDKNWPRYSVVVFIDQSSKPGHTLYRVGVARRPSRFVEWIDPIAGDNPIQDRIDWKKQVVPACREIR